MHMMHAMQGQFVKQGLKRGCLSVVDSTISGVAFA